MNLYTFLAPNGFLLCQMISKSHDDAVKKCHDESITKHTRYVVTELIPIVKAS